jgi:S1-C subfamily serine protease
MRPILATALVAAVCGALAGGVVVLATNSGDDSAAHASAGATPATPVAAPSGRTLSAAEIYRRDAPAVVVITATTTEKVPSTFFTPSTTQKVQSLGSGFVIDTKGDIVTNDHVVAGAGGIRAGFSGGATYPAKVIGADASTDLAVVRIKAPASALHPLVFADSGKAQIGDPVYAIGNPFGLDRTMTAGIISATGRDLQALNNLTIANGIQTDAPINHGNSGGPLLDSSGRVIGVNSQIEGGTVDANVGIGFAISSDTAAPVARELIAHGSVAHGWLGVEVQTLDPAVTKVVHGVPAKGALVARVTKGSPAAKAGLQAGTHQVTVDGASALLGGDTITALDSSPITSSDRLAEAIGRRKPGDKVTLTVVRDGSTRTVRVTLGSAPQQQPQS